MQEADMSMTNMAMNGSPEVGTENLLVKFFSRPMQDRTASEEAGRPIFKDEVFISIMQPGNKLSAIERKLREGDKHRFPEHWRRFQLREDQQADSGTPLSEWPGVTRSQAEELKFFNILTVEHLVSLADVHASKIMGIQALKTKAKAWLEASTVNADATALAKANERIDELTQLVESLVASQKADSIAEATAIARKPKRKRRTKAEMEAAKAS